jgi:hypothetical protein
MTTGHLSFGANTHFSKKKKIKNLTRKKMKKENASSVNIAWICQNQQFCVLCGGV